MSRAGQPWRLWDWPPSPCFEGEEGCPGKWQRKAHLSPSRSLLPHVHAIQMSTLPTTLPVLHRTGRLFVFVCCIQPWRPAPNDMGSRHLHVRSSTRPAVICHHLRTRPTERCSEPQRHGPALPISISSWMLNGHNGDFRARLRSAPEPEPKGE